jgi:hypothetical protein
MPHILLTGAGFTRNWGGWLAKELEGDLLGRLANHPKLRTLVQNSPNYEDALEMARSRESGGAVLSADEVNALEQAIKESFGAMNLALAQRRSLDLSPEYARTAAGFLTSFDAIFTLNQDLLLEFHYYAAGFSHRNFIGSYYPGLEPAVVPATTPGELFRHLNRRVATIGPADPERQPIYKLHGSVDWQDGSGGLFVVGGGKESYIRGKSILSQYFDLFRESLSRPNTRLMIIGYGWGDDHVNRLIFDASKANHSLGIFHVHPEGRDAILRGGSQPVVPYSVPTLSSLKCIGESRRLLTTTFGGDTLEYDKLIRFFS